MNLQCPFPINRYPRITLAHGGGGRLTQQLIDEVFREYFSNDLLNAQHDGAYIGSIENAVLTTDSFVVKPLEFPGGDIGKLAVCGIANDLAACGARPRFMSCGFILEEGLPTETLIRVVRSMAVTAREIGMLVVAGDTKVVERGKGDGIYLQGSGVGQAEFGRTDATRLQPGNALIVSGDIGRHGVAILACREEMELEVPVESDCAHIWPLVNALFEGGVTVNCLRDLTRGGLATVAVELCEAGSVGMRLEESCIPVIAPVRGVCEILGLDPLYVANEGTFLVAVPHEQASLALNLLKKAGASPARIGSVVDNTSRVILETGLGGGRVLDRLSGEQLPRIC